MKRGFKIYGIIGVVLIVLVEVNFFLKIQPFASWYFPIVWFAYIFLIDSLVFKIKGSSLISNRFKSFLGIVIISAFFWYIFELTNLSIQNWSYSGTEALGAVNGAAKSLFGIISFATVLPALFETSELIRAIHLFDEIKLHRKHRLTKRFLYIMMSLGVVSFILPIILPAFTFPLVWLSFFFFLDPVNYMNNQPSIIGHLRDRKLAIPLTLLLAGIILGFLWEFWNFYAVIKWTYDVPFVGFFKIFEMPLLGYLGYFPFAFELYAMYFFVRSLFVKKEKVLVG